MMLLNARYGHRLLGRNARGRPQRFMEPGRRPIGCDPTWLLSPLSARARTLKTSASTLGSAPARCTTCSASSTLPCTRWNS